MRSAIRQLLELQAKFKIQNRCKLSVGEKSVVLFRQIASSPPHTLTIGNSTIFRAAILADRPDAVVEVGSNTFVGGSKIVCAERITIGNDVLVSWGCTIVDHDSHSVDWQQRANDVRDTLSGTKDWTHVNIAPVRIQNRAWIGFNSIILKGVTIGEGAVVGAGSVVTKDVEPYTVVAGNPAKLVRRLQREE